MEQPLSHVRSTSARAPERARGPDSAPPRGGGAGAGDSTAKGSPRRLELVDVAGWLPAVYAGVLPVLFIPSSVDAYVLPRAAITVFFGGLLLAAGLLVRFAERRRAARAPAPPPPGLGPMARPLLAVAAAAVLAFATSVNPWLSLAGAYTRYESLLTRLAYLGLFAGAAWLLGRPRSRRLVEPAFIVGCGVAAVEAIFQGLTHALPRPDGNLGQAGLLGALLAMAIPISLQAGFRYRPWLLTLPLLCLGLFESSSRSGWLAALAGVMVVLVGLVPAAWRRRALVASAVLVALALGVLLLSPLRNLNQDTGAARLGVWGDALRMAAARPLTGWGEDATGLVFGRFQSTDWEPGNTFDRIHDQPLDLLVTQGLVGSAAAAWMWVVFWRRAGRALSGRPSWPGGLAGISAPLGACVAYQCWALLNFDWAPATGPAFLFAGLAWTAMTSADHPDPGRSTRPTAGVLAHRVGWAGPVAGALVMIAVGGIAAAAPVLADQRYFAGDRRGATTADPIQARYHQALGEQLGHTPAGLAELLRAEQLGDYDYAFLIELGDTAHVLGRPDLARHAYQRAVEVYRFDPTGPQRLRELGR